MYNHVKDKHKKKYKVFGKDVEEMVDEMETGEESE